MDAHLTYRQTAVRGASPVRLIVLLYEQAIADLRQAVAAQKRGDIEARTQAINHAALLISHLENSLNRQEGGQVTIDLERFYNQLRQSLFEAQCKQSATILEQQISDLMLVREAWCEVDRIQAEGMSAENLAPLAPREHSATDWKV